MKGQHWARTNLKRTAQVWPHLRKEGILSFQCSYYLEDFMFGEKNSSSRPILHFSDQIDENVIKIKIRVVMGINQGMLANMVQVQAYGVNFIEKTDQCARTRV